MNREKWDIRFLELAKHVAYWSKDPSTRVGAVIADQQNRIISLGFNGPPAGTLDLPRDRDSKLRRTIHAEANAMHFANRDVKGCSIYITHPPCAHCTSHIIQRGITRIVYIKGSQEFEERWAADIAESKEMCLEACVTMVEARDE